MFEFPLLLCTDQPARIKYSTVGQMITCRFIFLKAKAFINLAHTFHYIDRRANCNIFVLYSNVFGTTNILSFSPGAFLNVFSLSSPFVTTSSRNTLCTGNTFYIGSIPAV